MKKITFIIGILCAFGSAKAQSIFDAMRYSHTNYTANARAMAIGGAFGALGGNSLSSSINPAGIAFHPTSEFTASLAYLNGNTSTQYGFENTEDAKYALNIPNLSYTYSEFETDFGKPVKEGWINHSFTMNLNRSNSFGRNMLLNGEGISHGMVNHFAEDATKTWNDGYPLDSSTFGGLAYFGYLIDPTYDSDSNVIGFIPSVMDVDDTKYNQLQSLASRGNITDMNFGWAGNYSNKFYVGINMGLPMLNYREQGSYIENNLYDGDDNYNAMELKHTLKDNGIGINVSAGLIYRPVKFLRLGIAAKTPTFFSITRTYEVSLTTDTDVKGIMEIEPSKSETEYRLITPYQFTLSAAAILFKRGFVSIDYMVSDPSSTRLRGPGLNGGAQYFTQNRKIQQELMGTNQLRLGAEWTIGPLALRGGYSTTSTPFASNIDPYGPSGLTSYSGGIGFRDEGFFVDLGFQTTESTDYFTPYYLNDGSNIMAKNNNLSATVMATVGFTF
ncbi:MAG: hypothetical protein KDC92_01950 [Bacteroidetes bacterium]|nr:hypothetical protein [Bacteroidota bacterium]